MGLEKWLKDLLQVNNELPSNEIKEKGLAYDIKSLSAISGLAESTLYRLLSENNEALPRRSTIKRLETALGAKYEKSLEEESVIFMIDPSKPKVFSVVDEYFNHKCAICCSSAISGHKEISRHNEKLQFIYDSDEEDIIYLPTCEQCDKAVSQVYQMSYSSIIFSIIEKGERPLRLSKDVLELKMNTPITNQTLLAAELDVDQSTISRIVSKKIEFINPNLARKLHILCAKRLINNEFKLPLKVDRKVAVDELYHQLTKEYHYPDSFIMKKFSKHVTTEQIVSCDMMVFNNESKPFIACFIIDDTLSKTDVFNTYVGLSILLGVRYFLLSETNLPAQVRLSCKTAYELYSFQDGIHARGIPINQIPCFEDFYRKHI